MTIAAYRYNNPFDVSLPIAGYKGPGSVVGINGQKGYAQFPDMSSGYGAGVQRLQSYISGGSSYGPKTSITALNGVYATDPNWSRGVSKYSGIGPDETLDPNNPAQMSKLQYGVLAQEIGPANAASVVQNYGGTAPPAPAAPMSMGGPAPSAGAPPDASAQLPAAPAQSSGPSIQGSGAPSITPAQIAQIAQVPQLQNILPQNRMRLPFSLGG